MENTKDLTKKPTTTPDNKQQTTAQHQQTTGQHHQNTAKPGECEQPQAKAGEKHPQDKHNEQKPNAERKEHREPEAQSHMMKPKA
ncbi:MAG: hypothetical protein WAT41_11835 [Flavobacteriales bacterium]